MGQELLYNLINKWVRASARTELTPVFMRHWVSAVRRPRAYLFAVVAFSHTVKVSRNSGVKVLGKDPYSSTPPVFAA
jgi:hypothetical protein